MNFDEENSPTAALVNKFEGNFLHITRSRRIKCIRWITWSELISSNHNGMFRIMFIGDVGFKSGFFISWWSCVIFWRKKKFIDDDDHLNCFQIFLRIFGYRVLLTSPVFQPTAPPGAGLAGLTGFVGANCGSICGTSVYGAGGWNETNGIVPRTIGILPSKFRWAPATSTITYRKHNLLTIVNVD